MDEVKKGVRNGAFKGIDKNLQKKKIVKMFNLYKNNDETIHFKGFVEWFMEKKIKTVELEFYNNLIFDGFSLVIIIFSE